MNTVPIALAFDNNLVMPACITISSLLMNAADDTFYDIFILHSAKVPLRKEELNKLPLHFDRCRLSYREVDNTFEEAFEIRGITTPAYYRLLIPEIIPEYEKIIYSDADVIFRMDLTELYSMDISAYDLAATRDFGLNFGGDGVKYIVSSLGLKEGEYLQSGLIVLNSQKLRQENKVALFKQEARKNYKFQDQDILNVVCRGQVCYLSPFYNMTDYSYRFIMENTPALAAYYSTDELKEAMRKGNIHYNGHKPWRKYCVNFDIWWEYYRKSPFFNERFYFDFFNDRLNELDRLPLWKRVKILIRYFVYGKRKI